MTEEQHDAKSAEGTTELPRDYAVTQAGLAAFTKLSLTVATSALPEITSVVSSVALQAIGGTLPEGETFVSTLLKRLQAVVTGVARHNLKAF